MVKYTKFIVSGLIVLFLVFLASFIPLKSVADSVSSTIWQVIVLSSIPSGASVDSTIHKVVITGGSSGSVTLTGQACTANCSITTNLVNANAITGSFTATLLPATATNTPVQVCKTDNSLNAITVMPAGTDTINGNGSFVLNRQYQCVNLSDTSTGNWTISSTDFVVTQTLSPHIFATQLSANKVLSGLPITAGDVPGTTSTIQNSTTGTTLNSLFTFDGSGNAVNVTAGSTGQALGICDSNCGVFGIGSFFSGAGLHLCNFDNTATVKHYVGISASINGNCTDVGTSPPAGAQTVGLVKVGGAGAGVYLIDYYGPDFNGAGGAGGSVNTGATGNSAIYGTTSVISPVANEFHIGAFAGNLLNMAAACPQVGWTLTTSFNQWNRITDSNGCTEIDITAGSHLTGSGSHPAWPACVAGSIGTQTVDNAVTWELEAVGQFAPSVACTFVIDQGTYTLASEFLLGTDFMPAYMKFNGGRINITNTGGSGHAGIVESDKGHIVGSGIGGPAANAGNEITSSSSANIDSLVESENGYLSHLGSNPQSYPQTLFDVQGLTIGPSTAMTLVKAVIWEAGIEAQGLLRNMTVGAGPNNSIGILVDNTTHAWNQLVQDDVFLSVAGESIGEKVTCVNGFGSNMVIKGGGFVDGNSRTAAHLVIDGSGGGSSQCGHINLVTPYFESATGEAPSAVTPSTIVAQINTSNSACPSPLAFAGLPGGPTTGEQCSITDASTCIAGSSVTAGGGTTIPLCNLTWNGANWIARTDFIDVWKTWDFTAKNLELNGGPAIGVGVFLSNMQGQAATTGRCGACVNPYIDQTSNAGVAIAGGIGDFSYTEALTANAGTGIQFAGTARPQRWVSGTEYNLEDASPGSGVATTWLGASASVLASTKDYIAFGEDAALAVIGTQASAQGVWPLAGIANNLRCFVTTAAGAVGDVFTMEQNGSASPLTCTVTNTLTTCNDVTHNVTFAPGDKIDIVVNPAANNTNATGVTSCSFMVNG